VDEIDEGLCIFIVMELQKWPHAKNIQAGTYPELITGGMPGK